MSWETGSSAAWMSSSRKASKRIPHPKIEVYRKALGKEFLSRDDDALLAVAGDDPGGVTAPRFDLGDVTGLVDLIEKKVIRA
jgi:molybdopterin-guanine dinucleotide biosynthesis adapter protein